MAEFEGKSNTESVDAALKDALRLAEESVSGADRQISYIVKLIAGTRGGIAGTREVKVRIEANIK